MTSIDGCRLRAENVTLRYDQSVVSENLSVDVPDGSFTAIIGPNACGKSTLLRALAGLLTPAAGRVVLDGTDMTTVRAKERARRLVVLPQTMTTPEGITVTELVERGRYAHQSMLRRHSRADETAVRDALHDTSMSEHADRRVDELSGGQRQRAWIAMVLAQQTDLVLLDEPTTYLDVAHQIDVLNVMHRLVEQGRTIVAVLHDLNHAARYASHVVTMKDGRIIAEGTPAQTITSDLVAHAFDMPNIVVPDPLTGAPMVVPADTRARSDAGATVRSR